MWVSPPPDKRAEAEAARNALATQVVGFTHHYSSHKSFDW